MGINYDFAMRYRNSTITVNDIKTVENVITKECRFYLIGLFGIQEKQKRHHGEAEKDILKKIGKYFNYSAYSVARSCLYVRAIERLENYVPEIIPNIFEGQNRLSVVNTIILSNMESDDIQKIINKLSNETKKVYEIFPRHLSHQPEIQKPRLAQKISNITVKDTPAYDPDSQISGLTFTVPSWVSAIEKVIMNTNFSEISAAAREKFSKEIKALKDTIEIILDISEEEV